MAGTLGSRFTIGLGLMLVIIASLLVVSCGGGNSATTPPTPPAPSPVVPGSAFTGSVILGTPSSTRVVANVYSADQSGTVYIAWGGTPGSYTSQTSSVTLNADKKIEEYTVRVLSSRKETENPD